MSRAIRKTTAKDKGSKGKAINEQISDWRLGKSIGQVDLAKKLGYSQTTISKIERGKIPVTENFLSRLKATYGITFSAS